MKLNLLILFFFGAFYSHSQITIFGTVKNEKGKIIPGVSVYESHQKIGVPTLNDGSFEIELEKKNIEIHISHLGYKTKVIKLNKSTLLKLQKIDVVLIEKIKTFDPVVVNSSPVKKVIDQDNLLIKDFEFYGDSLILLLKSPDKGYFVEIKDEYADKGIRFKLNFRPKYLEYDCFGNIQIVAKDSVYQIALIDSNIQLVDQFSIKTYKELIQSCVAENFSHYAFQSIGVHGKSINYTFFPKDSSEEKTQIKILDFVGFKVAAFYYIEIIQLYNASVSYGDNIISGGIWDGDMKDLNETPKLNQMIVFYDKILSRPIYSPLFNSKNQFILFDHTNGYIEYPFLSKEKVKITYHETRKWIELISFDKWTNEFVTYFKKNGIYTAHYINKKTGTVGTGVILEENAYPEKLKLKKGYIYYLHKYRGDFYGNVLLKQKIKIQKSP